MAIGSSLDNRLADIARSGRLAPGVDAVIAAVAKAAGQLAGLVALGPLGGDLAAAGADRNADGDAQRALDIIANDCFIGALRHAPVACVASEELDAPLVLDPDAPLALALDPLDGSSNIDTNISIGSIFSVLPFETEQGGGSSDPLGAFLVSGRAQLAAGFVIYGPQTALVLTVGHGVEIFILDRRTAEFRLAVERVSMPRTASEYAINASNYRHWDEPVRAYVDDCIAGSDGPRSKNFNMRWIASLVAEAYRILVRGGVFLYPGDRRPGYERGRLRLVYEANPIAFLMEQAGGAATDGVTPILDLRPTALHERIPLVFGSADKVARVARYHTDLDTTVERSPLFGRRGLLRV